MTMLLDLGQHAAESTSFESPAQRGRIGVGTKLPLLLVCAYFMLLTAKYGEGNWSETLISAITALAIANCTSSGITRVVFSSWPLVMIGKISYSVYLTHFIVIKYFPFSLGPNQAALAQLFLTVAISCVLYFAIEQPGRRIGARFAAAVEQTPRQRGGAEPIAATHS